MNINKSKNNQDGFFYKLMTLLAVAALVVIIILIAASASHRGDSGVQTDPSSQTTENPAPDVTTGQEEPPVTTDTEPDGSDKADTTESGDTTEPDETSGSTDTTAEPVTSPPETTQKPSNDQPREGVPTEETFFTDFKGTALELTEDAGQEYIDNIIFLGDSTTYGLKAYRMLKDEKETLQVWTPLNGTLLLSRATSVNLYYPDTKEEITVAEAAKRKKPSMMVITLGVNGVSFMNEAQFKDAYISLINVIKEASPDTKIILQSIFPVSAKYDTSKGIDNDKINAANIWVAEVAQECGVKFLYTATALRDSTGYYLNESFQNGDGLHLNEKGFEKELNYIRTHAFN